MYTAVYTQRTAPLLILPYFILFFTFLGKGWKKIVPPPTFRHRATFTEHISQRHKMALRFFPMKIVSSTHVI